MAAKGSLLHLQVSATCPYPEPDQSTPCPHIPFLEGHIKYYPSIYSSVFPSGFPIKT